MFYAHFARARYFMCRRRCIRWVGSLCDMRLAGVCVCAGARTRSGISSVSANDSLPAIHIGRMFHFCNHYYNISLLVSLACVHVGIHNVVVVVACQHIHFWFSERDQKRDVQKKQEAIKPAAGSIMSRLHANAKREKKPYNLSAMISSSLTAFFPSKTVMMQLPDKNAIFFSFLFFRWRIKINGNWNIWTVQCWAETIFDICFNSSLHHSAIKWTPWNEIMKVDFESKKKQIVVGRNL